LWEKKGGFRLTTGIIGGRKPQNPKDWGAFITQVFKKPTFQADNFLRGYSKGGEAKFPIKP